MVVCKQGLILTITIRLKCPFVDVGHHWEVFSFLVTSFRGTQTLGFGLLLTAVQDIKLLPCFQWAPCLISLSFAFFPNSGISLLHCAHIDVILQTWALPAVDAAIIIFLK